MLSIPFSGSKKYTYKQIKKVIEDGGYDAVFEPFGGSCVLSVNIKNDGLVDIVVANDYDHFFDRYLEYLDLKDEVVKECYALGFNRTTHTSIGGVQQKIREYQDGTREIVDSLILPEKQIQQLQAIIKEKVPEELYRYFGYGNNFTYSAVANRKVYLADFRYFNAYLKTDRQRAFYAALQNLKLEHLDYRDFIKKHKETIGSHKSLIIADPPYTDTCQDQYKEAFDEEDTKALIEILKDTGSDFIFFNSDPDKVSEWLAGFDYTFIENGTRTLWGGRNRKDVLAYVRQN